MDNNKKTEGNDKDDKDDKEENVSLKGNKEKENSKKKKSKKIVLENIDLGTTPINISSSKYDYLDYQNLAPHIKNRIKVISIIAVVVIVFIILLTLKGKFHQINNNEISENNNLIDNQNIPVNSNKPASSLSSLNNNVTAISPSASSNKKEGQ